MDTAGIVELYGESLHAQGDGWSLAVAGGGRAPLRVTDWTCDERDGDSQLLALCAGSVLDVGCGPGRLAAALADRGTDVLGIDLAPEAVRLAHRRGAPARVLDVFGPVPRAGSWDTVLLADGNVGIGGDPVELLSRCRELAAPGGRVVLEVAGRTARSGAHLVRLEHAERRSAWFPWASLSVVDLDQVAQRAGLTVAETHRCSGGRELAVLEERSAAA